MHKNLELVYTQQPKPNIAGTQISDMEIILTQALLMDAGAATFKAFKSAEMANILVGLVSLSYIALQIFAMQKNGLIENKGEGFQIYQKLAIMQFLSAKIHHCCSGEAKRYAELYYTCNNLASGYLNADFDKAFSMYHQWRISYLRSENKISSPVDLTDCLYE